MTTSDSTASISGADASSVECLSKTSLSSGGGPAIGTSSFTAGESSIAAVTQVAVTTETARNQPEAQSDLTYSSAHHGLEHPKKPAAIHADPRKVLYVPDVHGRVAPDEQFVERWDH